MKILPFKRKQDTPAQPVARKGPTLILKGCEFVGNGVGIMAGENSTVDMTDTRFSGNKIAISTGTIDARIFAAIEHFSPVERAKAVVELDNISKASTIEERNELIKKATLSDKLSTVANATTVFEWISNVVSGKDLHNSLGDLIEKLMS